MVGGASAGTGTGRTVTTTPLGLVSLATAPDNRAVTISVETCTSGCSRRAYYLDGTTHVVVAMTALTSTQLTDVQLIAQGRAFLDRTLVPLQLEDRTIGTATYRQVFYMNGIQKVYVVNTQDLTGLTTDIDANLLAAAMRITGSTRVRYLLGTGRPAHRRGHGHLRRRHVQERRLRRRLGHRHERGAYGAHLRRRRRDRGRDRPGHRGQHRRQRAQQPRLDGRRLPAARRLHAGALEHHRPRRRVHAERTRRRLDLGRRRPCTGAPVRTGHGHGRPSCLGHHHRLLGQHAGLPLLAQRPVGDRRGEAHLPPRGLELPGDRGSAHRGRHPGLAGARQQHPGPPAVRPPVRLGPRHRVLDRPQGAAERRLDRDHRDGPGGAPAGQRLPDPRRPQQRLGDHPARRRRAVRRRDRQALPADRDQPRARAGPTAPSQPPARRR